MLNSYEEKPERLYLEGEAVEELTGSGGGIDYLLPAWL